MLVKHGYKQPNQILRNFYAERRAIFWQSKITKASISIFTASGILAVPGWLWRVPIPRRSSRSCGIRPLPSRWIPTVTCFRGRMPLRWLCSPRWSNLALSWSLEWKHNLPPSSLGMGVLRKITQQKSAAHAQQAGHDLVLNHARVCENKYLTKKQHNP
jgi:hypothetical protein